MSATLVESTMEIDAKDQFCANIHGWGEICGGITGIDSEGYHSLSHYTALGANDGRKVRFHYTLSGSGWFRMGQAVRQAGVGQGFICDTPSVCAYRKDVDCPQWKVLWVEISGHGISRILDRCSRLYGTVVHWGQDSHLAYRAQQLVSAGIRVTTDSNHFLKERLLRWIWELEGWVMEHTPSAREQDMLQFVRSYTQQNLRRTFRLSEMAREYGLSCSGFSHSFQTVTGSSPIAYANKVRMEEALRLLSSTRLSVKEIAVMLGFASSDYFCKSFRRHHLMSPGAYRHTEWKGIRRQKRYMPIG